MISETILIMHNIEPVDGIFNYKFSKKVPLINQIQNSSNIVFTISEEEVKEKICKFIEGFTIKIEESLIEPAEEQSRILARNLKNIITIKSTMPTEIYLQDYRSIPRGGTASIGKSTRTSFSIEGSIQNLNLNDPNIQSIINSNEQDSLKYQFLSKGILHYYYDNNVDCIRELFKLIENNDSFPNYYKYQVLRHLFSHPPPYHKTTINLFASEFSTTSFEYNTYDVPNRTIIINIESQNSKKELERLTSNLISQLRKDLNLES